MAHPVGAFYAIIAVLTGWLHRMESVVREAPDTQTAVEETASEPALRLTELVILLTPTVIDGV